MSGLKSYSTRADHSVLRQSIEVTKTGMRQAIHALECGSKEVGIIFIETFENVPNKST